MTKNNEQEKRLNLKNDVIFKTFFSRKGNEEFLIDFLNALLKIEIKSIKIREEANLERLQVDEKGGRLDIQAELNDGIIINIEMQVRDEGNMENRSMYYGAKTIARETQRETDYKDIKQVILINILDYEILGFDEYISKSVTVLENHRDYEMIKGIKWYFIELPKFRNSHPDMNEKLNQWLVFLDDYDEELVKMAEEKNKTLKKARFEMDYLTGEDEVRRLAELREKGEMDYISGMNHARREGESIGKKKNQLEVAKKMKSKNMDIDTIIELTGLSKEEIVKL